MKIISTLFLLTYLSFFQPKPTGFDAFTDHISRTHRIPASLKKECNWQYAAVRVYTDQNAKVTGYDIINEVPDDLKNSFAFIKGYQFYKSLKIGQRPIVFFYSIEDHRDDCDGPFMVTSPTAAANKFLSIMKSEQKRDPRTIILYDVVQGGLYSRRY